MAETVIRKACDRCHAQKLSCKRYNDEPCERCVRLKTECKSSPSLRYRKQQQQQQQQLVDNNSNHLQGQLPPTSSTPAPTGRRSPKRRRTDSQGDASLVPPDAVPIVPHTGVLAAASKSHVPVTPDPVLDAGDFGFTFDQLAFFPQHLSHPELPGGVVNDPHLVHPPAVFADSWDPRLALQLQPLRSRSCVPEHGSSDKRSRPRTKQRPRQITLRHDADHLSPLHPEAPPIHWMAQLSDINARLLDLASALPSPQEVAQNGPSLGRPADERFRSQGFPIEDMFKLTRRVTDILEKPPTDTPDRDGTRGHHSTIDGTDPGNAMFILSTYVRLLDMYQRVFSLVHAELSRADSGATFSFWKLPAVTVGSFAVESSPFLQMSLTIQLAEEFLCRLRGSTARWSGAGNAASMFAGVVDVSFQAFRDREEALAKHLVELRSEIEPLLDS
ncbi:hypothetical protein B0J15DRAFT_537097 [Fusarium solani]|uniref:Zn(2)-C6 fungal-type domain-containing protein n=1 Tax=Fusarium solani TaxID=169388 RepID=A0A9P9K8G7_FUSSL|nr:uncharacterized protein B0J15DRAFT_537097 [Fusarium solani]KAH7247890.1 hypothetical protein B0J15DRAFT_537097 [Fusarium solani]